MEGRIGDFEEVSRRALKYLKEYKDQHLTGAWAYSEDLKEVISDLEDIMNGPYYYY